MALVLTEQDDDEQRIRRHNFIRNLANHGQTTWLYVSLHMLYVGKTLSRNLQCH